MLGGRGPANSRATYIAAGGAPELHDCLDTRQLAPGAILRFEQAGGGGYGDPFARAAESVRADVETGYISPEAAAESYGVVLADGGAIDGEATRTLRARR